MIRGKLAGILIMMGISLCATPFGADEQSKAVDYLSDSPIETEKTQPQEELLDFNELVELKKTETVVANKDDDYREKIQITPKQDQKALAQPVIEEKAEQVVKSDPAEVQKESEPGNVTAVVSSYDVATLEGMNYTPEQVEAIRAFYEDSVFAGDSVLLGFRNYAAKSSDPAIHEMQFLAAGSLSLHNAFWEVSSKSVHPLYQGEQHQIWDSVSMMGAKRAFLFFGINDVAYGVDASVPMYQQLVDKIREKSPDIDITIISATYTLKDKGQGSINNDNLAAFNTAVRELASQNNWGYIDMANALSDGQGNLADKYCSDGFLHESKAAYDVWSMMMYRYAADRLGF